MRAPLSKSAYFFKFIKPGLMSQLSIPISFRKYIGSYRNNKTAILKRGSQKWSVKINDWAFNKGWDNFVRENGVQAFDMVVFMHEGDMVFNTLVFDHTQSWCERDTELSRKSLKKFPKENAIPDLNHHPHFKGTLKSADCEYRLYLPISFTRSNGLRRGKMILRNGQSQMSWAVDLKIKAKSYTCIGQGWRDFYKANGLKEGDHYKLELIQTGINPIANFYNLSTKQLQTSKPMENTQLTYFHGTLKGYEKLKICMYIPRKFALDNGLSCGDLILRNVGNEGSWTVNLRNHMGKRYFFLVGLKEFCTANGLEKGDTVKF